jgi:hypothetical protein
MSFNVNELLGKIGGNDLVKSLGDKVGVGAEQAGTVAQDLLAHAKETGGNLLDSAKAIAEKTGLPLDKVEGIAGGLTTTLTEKAGQLGESAQAMLGGLMGKLNETPVGDMLKGLDKDGDGNPINDVTDAAKSMLGGLFGKK